MMELIQGYDPEIRPDSELWQCPDCGARRVVGLESEPCEQPCYPLCKQRAAIREAAARKQCVELEKLS